MALSLTISSILFSIANKYDIPYSDLIKTCNLEDTANECKSNFKNLELVMHKKKKYYRDSKDNTVYDEKLNKIGIYCTLSNKVICYDNI